MAGLFLWLSLTKSGRVWGKGRRPRPPQLLASLKRVEAFPNDDDKKSPARFGGEGGAAQAARRNVSSSPGSSEAGSLPSGRVTMRENRPRAPKAACTSGAALRPSASPSIRTVT